MIFFSQILPLKNSIFKSLSVFPLKLQIVPDGLIGSQFVPQKFGHINI